MNRQLRLVVLGESVVLIKVIVDFWRRRNKNVIARRYRILFRVQQTTKLRLKKVGTGRR